MPFYQRHAFICANQASDDSRSCGGDHDALGMVKYAKNRLQELGMFGPNQTRLNKSGCLGRCSVGPVLVVYPEGTWYTYDSKDDIEEIIQEHLIKGNEVDRLKV